MLACMKGISSIGAFLILIVGVGMTAITIYGFTHSELFLDDTSHRSAILGVMIAADLLIILGAVAGIYGLKKGKAFCICLFQVFVILFLIVFFSLGIAAEVIPSKFFDGNCTNSDNPTIQLAFNTSKTAKTKICTLLCPCNMTQDAFSKYSFPDQAIIIGTFYNRTGSALKAQDCPGGIFTEQQKNMADALGAIQNLIGCTDWCPLSTQNPDAYKYSLIYKFSNVNNGKPNGYCYTQLKDHVQTYSNVVGIGSFVTAAFLLLICIINTCLCCHPKRKGLSLKDRFVYMKDGQYEKI